MRIDSAPQTTDLGQVVLELSGLPITRPTPLIGHGDDLNGRVGDAVDHGVGKTPKKKFSRAVQIPRPAFGEVADFTHGMIEFRNESRSCHGLRSEYQRKAAPASAVASG